MSNQLSEYITRIAKQRAKHIDDMIAHYMRKTNLDITEIELVEWATYGEDGNITYHWMCQPKTKLGAKA